MWPNLIQTLSQGSSHTSQSVSPNLCDHSLLYYNRRQHIRSHLPVYSKGWSLQLVLRAATRTVTPYMAYSIYIICVAWVCLAVFLHVLQNIMQLQLILLQSLGHWQFSIVVAQPQAFLLQFYIRTGVTTPCIC